MIALLSVGLERKQLPWWNAKSSILMVLDKRYAIGIVSKDRNSTVFSKLVKPSLVNGLPGLNAP